MMRGLVLILVGVGIGYSCKPQLDRIVRRAIRAIRNRGNRY